MFFGLAELPIRPTGAFVFRSSHGLGFQTSTSGFLVAP
jgi:hypothetical protein